jgi:L-asparaginase II
VCKGGAEAYQIIGVMPGVLRKDSPGMGIAVKISDGDPHGRAVSAVSLEILSALGALSDNDLLRLSAFGSKQVQNWRKITVGKIRTVFSLEAI